MVVRARLRLLARRLGVTGKVAVAVALALALVGAAGALWLAGPSPGGVTIERAEAGADAPSAEGTSASREEVPEGERDADPETVVVHVDGAVAAPGVYELEAGSRANDAIAAAGGLAEGADTSSLNLAQVLADGTKIHVPLEGEAAAASGMPGSAGASPVPVNINTAGMDELDALPGIGEATARAIVEDREQNGPFATPEDLMRVSGIGERKFEQLEGLVCV